MALFGNSTTAHRLPEYRVAALASLDLEEHMKDSPLVLDRPGHIEWMVTEDEDGYLTAHGAIRVPVNIVFAPPAEEGADPEIERVIVNGKRKFDRRVGEEELHDKNYGLDVTKAQAETFVRYRKNMKS
ncbi:MAG: hypothetical protein V8R08_03125 [Coriobacteriales bacterium]